MTRLSLALLGPMQITLRGRPVGGFTYHKARALLAYLAVETNHPHHRDALAALLWPDMPDEAARHNLRQALANLRAAIGDAAATPPFMLITRDAIQFNSGSDDDLDVSAFAALLTACESHAHRDLTRCRSCAARMEQAMALYRGDFLAGFNVGDSAPFEDWLLRQRERLHQRALDTLARLADYQERRGDQDRARHYAQRQIELDPWREEAHRQLMRLLARAGQRSAALAQYETCRGILARELGVEPAAETTALYERIRDGALRSKNQEPRPEQTRHTRLPVPPTALIGRESELAALGALLENPACQLITITGPGGIGKTRLALAAASEHADVFADGTAFVPLAGISSAVFSASAILAALDVALQGQRDPRAQLFDYLREKDLLLIVDNVEHLLGSEQSENEAIADLLADLLRHAPGVTLLLTSRERLALPGEWLFDLSGLSYPAGEMANGLESYGAVQLFVQRARQARRQFVLGEGEVGAVGRICRLVEGLPLAIELAAAALRTRSCTAIAAAIERNLSTLTVELRAIPERQRSIRATFEHSWRLLSDEERHVFARLSVFRGGLEEEAAMQVAQASPQILLALVDKSLLRWDGAARYDLHELVRRYAGEKLAETGEQEQTRGRYVGYFLALAEAAERHMYRAEQRTWVRRLEVDHDNLRAALEWAIEHFSATGVRLAAALGWFWHFHSHHQEGREWLLKALTGAKDAQGVEANRFRAKALNQVGYLSLFLQDVAQAHASLEQSVALWRTVGDPGGLAQALCDRGAAAHLGGDLHQARARLEESIILFRQLGEKQGLVRALFWHGAIKVLLQDFVTARASAEESIHLGREIGDVSNIAASIISILAIIAFHQADYAEAQALWEEGLRLFRSVDDKPGVALTLGNLGSLAYRQGYFARAKPLFEERLQLWRELGNQYDSAWGLYTLGYVALRQNNRQHAAACFAESLALWRDLSQTFNIARCLAGLAEVAAVDGRLERASRLLGATVVVLESSGEDFEDTQQIASGRIPITGQTEFERNVAAVRANLGEEVFTATWAAGRAMTLEQAVAYALREDE